MDLFKLTYSFGVSKPEQEFGQPRYDYQGSSLAVQAVIPSVGTLDTVDTSMCVPRLRNWDHATAINIVA